MFKPHPPPNPEWPEYVKQIYHQGCDRIDELRKQIDSDEICSMPFKCYICDKMKDDYCKLNGDGCPMCVECLGGAEFVKEMEDV